MDYQNLPPKEIYLEIYTRCTLKSVLRLSACSIRLRRILEEDLVIIGRRFSITDAKSIFDLCVHSSDPRILIDRAIQKKNSKAFLSLLRRFHPDPENLITACRIKDEFYIDKILSTKAIKHETLLDLAIRLDHTRLFLSVKDKLTDINAYFLKVALNGGIKMLTVLLKNFDLKQRIYEQGLTNCIAKHNAEGAKLILQYLDNPPCESLYSAIKIGNVIIAKLLIDNNVKGINKSAVIAAQIGNLNMLDFLFSRGANNYDLIKRISLDNRDEEIFNIVSRYS